MSRDRLFLGFVAALGAIMAIFGLAMLVLIFFGNDDALVLRMVNVFASMFSSVVGLGTGYLLGKSAEGGSSNGGNGNGVSKPEKKEEPPKPPPHRKS